MTRQADQSCDIEFLTDPLVSSGACFGRVLR